MKKILIYLLLTGMSITILAQDTAYRKEQGSGIIKKFIVQKISLNDFSQDTVYKIINEQVVRMIVINKFNVPYLDSLNINLPGEEYKILEKGEDIKIESLDYIISGIPITAQSVKTTTIINITAKTKIIKELGEKKIIWWMNLLITGIIIFPILLQRYKTKGKRQKRTLLFTLSAVIFLSLLPIIYKINDQEISAYIALFSFLAVLITTMLFSLSSITEMLLAIIIYAIYSSLMTLLSISLQYIYLLNQAERQVDYAILVIASILVAIGLNEILMRKWIKKI
jgi:membrane-associated HD superfamily phosphohydrolase